MKKQVFLAAASMMTIGLLWAQTMPQLAYKDIYIGQDASYLRQNKQFNCSKDPKLTLGDESCVMRPGERPTIANVPATAVLAVMYDDRVHSIIVGFKPSDFTQVSQALEEKYGPPTETKKSIVTTAAGDFDNSELLWVMTDGTISTRKYGNRLTATCLEISSHESL